jgi:molybdate transport system substrate-binding protein
MIADVHRLVNCRAIALPFWAFHNDLRVIDRLGLTEQLRAKTILVPGAQAAEIVARGEAELGIGQASEIVPVSGAELLGPLPREIASVTVFTAGISAGTRIAEADKALIQFLSGPIAAPILKAKGFEPQ